MAAVLLTSLGLLAGVGALALLWLGIEAIYAVGAWVAKWRGGR